MHARKICGQHMQRLMEVGLLVLLSQNSQDCHGYCLAEKLKEFGFSDEELHISTLYRTLRGMEQAEWVSSHWEKGGQGPQRRVYAITPKGRAALDEWAAVLQTRRQRIDTMLEAYQKIDRSSGTKE